MKRYQLLVMFIFGSLVLSAQAYKPVDEGSKVKFVIKNFGINTDGVLNGLTGDIKFDRNDLSHSSFHVQVDSRTINTDIEARDNHLRKEEYLFVEKYPQINFTSTKISKTNTEDWLYIFGKITIRGITKSVKFPFKAIEKDGGILFEGEFTLNRRDFQVGGKSISLSDNLNVNLSVFAAKQ
jgi:polyisoprenoid-binding protein YceI